MLHQLFILYKSWLFVLDIFLIVHIHFSQCCSIPSNILLCGSSDWSAEGFPIWAFLFVLSACLCYKFPLILIFISKLTTPLTLKFQVTWGVVAPAFRTNCFKIGAVQFSSFSEILLLFILFGGGVIYILIYFLTFYFILEYSWLTVLC